MSQYPGYSANPYGGPVPQAQPPARRGMPVWVKVLIILAVIGGVLMVAICAGLMYIGAKAPPTACVPGSRVRASDMQTIRRLGLLEEGERIQFFYSDALINIENGMYFFTDRRVVVYSEMLAEPLIAVEYPEILDITAEFDGNLFVDSTIWLELEEDYVTFPVSSEGGGDRQFHKSLLDMWEKKR